MLFGAPVLSSLDPLAMRLSIGAIVAALWFKTGTLLTLAASSLAGVGLYLLDVVG